MMCPTIEVDRNGKKVIINLSDFNPNTMVKWGDSSAAPVAPVAPVAAAAPAAPAASFR